MGLSQETVSISRGELTFPNISRKHCLPRHNELCRMNSVKWMNQWRAAVICTSAGANKVKMPTKRSASCRQSYGDTRWLRQQVPGHASVSQSKANHLSLKKSYLLLCWKILHVYMWCIWNTLWNLIPLVKDGPRNTKETFVISQIPPMVNC